MPVPGTLNELYAPRMQPEQGGLSLPGQGPYVPPTPQREPGLNEIIGRLASMAGQTTSIPRMMAWNAGPAMVGRSGQGPQSGAELFGRLGMNGPVSGAIGAGLGAGLDLMADPANLAGMGAASRVVGAGRAAAPAAGNLTRRLEQFAGGGLQGAEQAAAARGLQSQQANTLAQQLEAMRQANPLAPGRTSGRIPPAATPRPRGPGGELLAVADEAMPSTVPGGNPAAMVPRPRGAPAEWLHAPGVSPPFLQQPPGPRGFPDFPTQLESARFMPGAQPPSTTPSLTRRLERMATPNVQVDSEGTPIVRSLAEQLRIQQRQGLSTQPLGGFRGATLPNGPIDY